MIQSPKNPDSWGWAGEPDLAAVYTLIACLVASVIALLLGGVGRI
jgi:hypothetical protein